jgi:hypothetical protein
MSLLGSGALAMWWNMAPEVRSEFEDWHAHEHFPERLGIPGFRRGSRWGSTTGPGVFVMYELEDYGVLSSSAYLERLNSPSPWSTKMMPHHRNMVRSQSHVLESRGGGVARHALTIRLAPQPGRDAELRASLKSLVAELFVRPGLTGAHLLKHETPAIPQTTEQKIRGANDRNADWVFIACGYDAAAVQALLDQELSADSLERLGARDLHVSDLYTLAYSAVAGDVS